MHCLIQRLKTHQNDDKNIIKVLENYKTISFTPTDFTFVSVYTILLVDISTNRSQNNETLLQYSSKWLRFKKISVTQLWSTTSLSLDGEDFERKCKRLFSILHFYPNNIPKKFPFRLKYNLLQKRENACFFWRFFFTCILQYVFLFQKIPCEMRILHISHILSENTIFLHISPTNWYTLPTYNFFFFSNSKIRENFFLPI